MGGPEKGNFPLLYVIKMSLRRWLGGWVVPKSLKTPLRNIKMVPNPDEFLDLETPFIYLNFHYFFRNLVLARQLFVFVILMAVIMQWLKLYLQLWESS